MATIGACLGDAEAQLRAVSETPRLDAELLMAHALGISRAQVLARLREAGVPSAFDVLLQRRLSSEPVAYIVGKCEFFSLEFRVRPPVLIPRPETEHLVETALSFLGGRPARVLDLCTGSGCVAIAIALNAAAAQVWATDLSEQALSLARENAALHHVVLRVCQGDLFDALDSKSLRFDCIVANPPYVEDETWQSLSRDIREYEDRRALVAGADGLSVIRRVIAEAPAWLQPGGLLALEMDGAQWARVRDLLHAHAFRDISCVADLAGIPRVAHGRMPV